MTIIAAIGKNNELGKDNDLIWHFKEDLQFFKKMTMNKTIVMGRKTFESLPRMLEGRNYVVLSSNSNFPSEVKVFSNVKDVLSYDNDAYVIGGGSVYKQFIDYVDTMYLTEINDTSDADAYFPIFDKKEWNSEIIYTCNDYRRVCYRRKNGKVNSN